MSSRKGGRRRPATSSGGDSGGEFGATAPSSPTSAQPRRRPPYSPRSSSSSASSSSSPALFELAGEEYQFYLEDGGGGGGRENPRSFSHSVKLQCWDKAEKVRGRDPDRWRRDYLGNVLFRKLVGCPGCYCHDYDHIVPYSKASLLAEFGSSYPSEVPFRHREIYGF
ncbi:unnamed protein product [Spirodela intermedia]|uniref:Uncharacterized protein n=1 Tax=Spirodela intermedia TaxID=51605 RepID=A0A7I8KTD4_SPIIN|nr:unnamed protein product [Spirodela intermedia]